MDAAWRRSALFWPNMMSPVEVAPCVGRFLLPDCKRKSNHEGLGSSLTFHRATVAYALLFNLTIADEPCATPLSNLPLSPTQKPG